MRNSIELQGAVVSNLQEIKGRPHSFSIKTPPHPGGKSFYFSFDNAEQAEEWQELLLETVQIGSNSPIKPMEKHIQLY